MLNKDNFQTSFTSVYLRKKVLHGLLIYKKSKKVCELPRVRDALPKNINFQNAVVD
jgi:hypothetical protein